MGSPYRTDHTPAVMVDLDPTDGFTTQLFAQTLRIENASGLLIEANAPVRSHSRWINSWRNLEFVGDRGSSAIWQLAFPKDSLHFKTEASPSLSALAAEAEAGQGIVMRLCFYLFQHRPYQEIADAYANNQRIAMPGQMVIAATIGVWGAKEPATLAPARILMPNLSAPLNIPAPIHTERKQRQFFLGVALAQADTHRKVVTLDLVNSIPEAAGFDTLTADVQHLPEKIDLGALSLQVLDSSKETLVCVGTITFAERASHEPSYNTGQTLLRGGIIEMPYPPELEEQILNGDLVLTQGDTLDAPVLLHENPYHVLVDARNVYLELEDPTPQAIPFQILKRGQPLTQPLVMRVQQTINRGMDAYTSSPSQPSQEREQESAEQDGVVEVTTAVTSDAQGFGVLSLRPLQAGMAKVWLYTPTDPDLSQIRFGTTRYLLQSELQYSLHVRVLPDDRQYDLVSDADLTWEYMQAHFFRYYALLYPVMNQYINFDDQAATEAMAPLISAFIATTLFNSTLYMPITRELSAGKRRLVQRWARLRR